MSCDVNKRFFNERTILSKHLCTILLWVQDYLIRETLYIKFVSYVCNKIKQILSWTVLLINKFIFEIQWGFSLLLRDLWRRHLRRIDKSSHPCKRVHSWPANPPFSPSNTNNLLTNPPFHWDINVWILKQWSFVNELKTAKVDHVPGEPFCSLTNLYCLNIQWEFSLRLKELWRRHLHRIDTASHPFKSSDSWPVNPSFSMRY